MKAKGILLCQALILVISVALMGGCESNQQISCEQEKVELQETIESQEKDVAKLKYERESVLHLLLEITTSADNCQKQLKELEKENKLLQKSIARSKRFERPAGKKKKLDLHKGVEELKAMRESGIKRLKNKAATESKEKE